MVDTAFTYPYVYLPVAARLAALPPSWDPAAGCSRIAGLSITGVTCPVRRSLTYPSSRPPGGW